MFKNNYIDRFKKKYKFKTELCTEVTILIHIRINRIAFWVQKWFFLAVSHLFWVLDPHASCSFVKSTFSPLSDPTFCTSIDVSIPSLFSSKLRSELPFSFPGTLSLCIYGLCQLSGKVTLYNMVLIYSLAETTPISASSFYSCLSMGNFVIPEI